MRPSRSRGSCWPYEGQAVRGSTWSEVVEGDYRLLNWDDNGGTIQQLVGREFRKNDFIQKVPISFIQLPRPISTTGWLKQETRIPTNLEPRSPRSGVSRATLPQKARRENLISASSGSRGCWHFLTCSCAASVCNGYFCVQT